MNVLGKQLSRDIAEVENKYKDNVRNSKYCTRYHLMPPVGWLNDPNGLCQWRGTYHVFFQYAPFDVNGGLKAWGHYTSKDMVNFSYEGAPLLPDQSFDCHGVYSGSAFTNKDKIAVYYTGNVKYDGDYDYINEGRGSNVVMVDSSDGITFGDKRLLLTNADYPEECTAHVRDPKVFTGSDGAYYMVLGARLKTDKGAILLYQSSDLQKFEYVDMYTTQDTFGYMWECPDLFYLDGKRVLSVSPQGVEREKYRYQNIYLSGYFVEGTENFQEWDMGFDFYAPQTFRDEQGRQILIGWAGVPDAEQEYCSKSIADGWQHCLTLPRELTFQKGKVYQYPLKEIEKLRTKEIEILDKQEFFLKDGIGEILLEDITQSEGSVGIGSGCRLFFWEDTLALEFTDDTGAGRRIRQLKHAGIQEIRILFDVSILEIYINHGEHVMTSKIFTQERDCRICCDIMAKSKKAYQYKPAKMLI